MKKLAFLIAVLSLAGFLAGQAKVDVNKISAPATGTQTAVNSDSIVCATDTRCIVTGSGTAGSAASGVVTVQGIASMTPLLSTLQTQTDTVMVGGVNIKEINAVTPLMGNGVTGTGSLRVTIASDNTAFSVNGTDVGTLADNGAAAAANRIGVLPAIAQSTLPSTATAGRNEALQTDLNHITMVGQIPIGMATYVASGSGATVASATDIAVLSGNATNVVLVNKVTVSCLQTTAGIIEVRLVKRTTADSGGTSASMTVVAMDSGDAAASSTALFYTGNPTRGLGESNTLYTEKLGMMAAATASPNDIMVWTGPRYGRPLVLRGTAQQLAVNLNGQTVTGGACAVSYEWTETTNYN